MIISGSGGLDVNWGCDWRDAAANDPDQARPAKLNLLFSHRYY
jgi:hypothetical protein